MKRTLLFIVIMFVSMAVSSQTLYIYGYDNGENEYTVFLGKINGSKYDSESIWNKYGEYGNKYNSKSIWNKYSEYGGKYSSCSPFNKFAAHPPKLFDVNHRFYGYFTANKSKYQRYNRRFIDMICDNYDKIPDDISDWYDVIF